MAENFPDIPDENGVRNRQATVQEDSGGDGADTQSVASSASELQMSMLETKF